MDVVIELSFDRRVRMEFGFDRLPTDQREGGREVYCRFVAPGNLAHRPPPPSGAPPAPYPRFY